MLDPKRVSWLLLMDVGPASNRIDTTRPHWEAPGQIETSSAPKVKRLEVTTEHYLAPIEPEELRYWFAFYSLSISYRSRSEMKAKCRVRFSIIVIFFGVRSSRII